MQKGYFADIFADSWNFTLLVWQKDDSYGNISS